MVNLTRDIHSLTDFKRNTGEFARQMKQTREPVVLTVNGRAEFVIQDAAAYQELLGRVEQAEAVTGIRRGLEQTARGEGRPAEEVFAELETRFSSDGNGE
jgi:prevent-host-death family protein